MKSLRRFAIAALCWSCLTVAALEQDPASQALVLKLVQAYGGAPAIEAMASLNAQGDIASLMRGERGTYKRWLARPRMLRVETAFPNSSETRILRGDKSWRSSPAKTMLVTTGLSHLATIYQYKQLDLPYGLLKGSYNLRHLGSEEMAGKATEVMEVWDDEGPTLRVNVNAADHLIARIAGQISFGGAATSLAVEFFDFRPVDGLQLPFRMNNFAGGAPLSQTIIQRYTSNPTPDASLFEPQVKGQASARFMTGGLLAGQSAAGPGPLN